MHITSHYIYLYIYFQSVGNTTFHSNQKNVLRHLIESKKKYPILAKNIIQLQVFVYNSAGEDDVLLWILFWNQDINDTYSE